MPDTEPQPKPFSTASKDAIILHYLKTEGSRGQLVESMVAPILFHLQRSLIGTVFSQAPHLICDVPGETVVWSPEAVSEPWTRLKADPHQTFQHMMERLREPYRKELDRRVLGMVQEIAPPQPGPIPEGWRLLVMHPDTLEPLPLDVPNPENLGNIPRLNGAYIVLSSQAGEGLVYAFGEQEEVGEAWVGLELTHDVDADDALWILHADLAHQIVPEPSPNVAVYTVPFV